jgi:hypothetical protein
MQAYICDRPECAKQAEPKEGTSLQPNGWYTLTQYYGPGGGFISRQNRHFCSPACLLNEVLEQQPPVEAAPPTTPPPALTAEESTDGL